MHQTVIGLEAKAQLDKVGDHADVVIACCGGGSNFGGLAFPFLADKFAGDRRQGGCGRTECLPDPDPRRFRL